MMACARYWLKEEIAACRPKVIVPMGATACKLFEEIELDKDHGMPLWVEKHRMSLFGEWAGWVWPSYHPAAGMHQTSLMIPLIGDFERMGQWRREKWEKPVGGELMADYQMLQDTQLCAPDQPFPQWLAVDTEEEYSIQFSSYRGHGRMVLRSDTKRLEWLRTFISRRQGILLHNATYDIPVLARAGIAGFKFRDTMQEAYHRGNLPQGLKALGWRLFGIRMKSWEDLVMPYSRARMVEWLSRAWDWVSDNRERQETQLKTKLKVTYRRTAMERDISRIIKHSHKPDYDIWERAEEAGLIKDELVEICGEVPRPGIGHVPIEEVVEYGCRDADVTGRVGAWMDQQPAVEVPVEDWDQ
jgi:hypothetical protein